jgi:hypothetical protein
MGGRRGGFGVSRGRYPRFIVIRAARLTSEAIVASVGLRAENGDVESLRVKKKVKVKENGGVQRPHDFLLRLLSSLVLNSRRSCYTA